MCNAYLVIRPTAFQPNGAKPVSSTDVGVKGEILGPDFKPTSFTPPRALETHEIPNLVQDFVRAAENSLEAGAIG
jgi:2,4-dienoyl-CoA reductase-like NADH-dependent reductase (Old Yellow Enzyme family)